MSSLFLSVEVAMDCPNCGTPCEADEVDIGVGVQRVGPWGCPACHWVEGEPEDFIIDDLIPDEFR